MTESEDRPKKTKQQLKRSAIYSLLTALMISVIPLIYIIGYLKHGVIYTGKPPIIPTTGKMALMIIYGTSAAAFYAILIAAFNITRCLVKIRRGEYSAKDESPEFVICRNCKTPQYSKNLINGRCSKCTGIVVSLEAYYHRHPKIK